MDIGTLLVILIFVAPIIEKIFTAGRKPPTVPPPRQRPAPGTQRPRREAPYDVPQSSGPVRTGPAEGRPANASDMLPDDLWELVTGEKRKPRIQEPATPAPAASLPRPVRVPRIPEPRHLPESTRSYDEEALDEEGLATREQQPSRELSIPRRVPLDVAYERVHKPPVLISLEDNIPTDEERHTQFHERLTHLPPAARMKVEVVPLATVLSSNAALRQAFILSEVFGKPRSLQD